MEMKMSNSKQISLLLPTGEQLEAKVSTDNTYPAINIYLVSQNGEKELICFVEYNPERSPCHELCIGAYQSDKEDVTYYEPYTAERESV